MQPGTNRTQQASGAGDFAARFGALVRERRQAMGLRQEDIAFATGFGRRFIIELEAGKVSSHLGMALAVAAAVGLRPLDLMARADSERGAARLAEEASRSQEPPCG